MKCAIERFSRWDVCASDTVNTAVSTASDGHDWLNYMQAAKEEEQIDYRLS